MYVLSIILGKWEPLIAGKSDSLPEKITYKSFLQYKISIASSSSLEI